MEFTYKVFEEENGRKAAELYLEYAKYLELLGLKDSITKAHTSIHAGEDLFGKTEDRASNNTLITNLNERLSEMSRTDQRKLDMAIRGVWEYHCETITTDTETIDDAIDDYVKFRTDIDTVPDDIIKEVEQMAEEATDEDEDDEEFEETEEDEEEDEESSQEDE